MRFKMVFACVLCCASGDAAATYGFDPAAALAPEAVNAASIAVGDVTGDGHQDVVVLGAGTHASYRDRVVVYAQQESGGFSAPATYAFSETPVSAYARELALADLDADGLLDIVVSYESNSEYRLSLLMNKAGQFDVTRYVSNARNEQLRFSDVDQDGHLDIMARLWPDRARVYFGNGVGGIRGDAAFPVSSAISPWLVEDMDNDGRRDLVYSTNDGIVMQRAEGSGFSSSVRTLLGVAPVYNIAVGDFNGDGRADIAGIRRASRSQIAVYLQDRSGVYRRSRVIDPISSFYLHLMVQDMDRDGRDDLVIWRFESMIDMYISNGSGFAPPRSYVGDETPMLAFGELNQDGRTDLVMANGGVSLLLSRKTPVESDVAVFIGLAPSSAAIRVENVGGLPSTSYNLRAAFDARSGTLAFGPLPEGCAAYPSDGHTDISCQSQPPLAAGQYRLYSLPFSKSNGGSRNTLTSFAKVTVSPDLRQDNNVAYRQLDIPAALPASQRPPATVPRKR
jgi:hypothetical protein